MGELSAETGLSTVMKVTKKQKIGFIDIHPYNPMCGQRLSPQARDQRGGDQSVIYVFKVPIKDMIMTDSWIMTQRWTLPL
jgi:hypothetical protein